MQATDGSQFVLTRVNDLPAFYVGDSDDLATEITTARANQELMKFLDERGAQAKKSRGIPLAAVRRQLDL